MQSCLLIPRIAWMVIWVSACMSEQVAQLSLSAHNISRLSKFGHQTVHDATLFQIGSACTAGARLKAIVTLFIRSTVGLYQLHGYRNWDVCRLSIAQKTHTKASAQLLRRASRTSEDGGQEINQYLIHSLTEERNKSIYVPRDVESCRYGKYKPRNVYFFFYLSVALFLWPIQVKPVAAVQPFCATYLLLVLKLCCIIR